MNREIKDKYPLNTFSQETQKEIITLFESEIKHTQINTSKINRIEVINNSDKGRQGKAYTYWSKYDNGIENPKVKIELQDDGKTLKIFIRN